eukprot:1279542-Pleurochrysis_carterae.AAC.2
MQSLQTGNICDATAGIRLSDRRRIDINGRFIGCSLHIQSKHALSPAVLYASELCIPTLQSFVKLLPSTGRYKVVARVPTNVSTLEAATRRLAVKGKAGVITQP